MTQEHEIIAQVCAAKEDSRAADQLVRSYLPFIKGETAKFIHRIPLEGRDDELSIAMLAFHEAALAYRRGRGAFLPFAAMTIRSRLIDYCRREQRYSQTLSLDQREGDGDEGRSLLEQMDTGRDDIAERVGQASARTEILEFAKALAEYGLELTDIADNCPRQDRTLTACHRALAYAKEHPQLLEGLTASKKLPLSQLSAGSGVERKTLERHRKYMMALLLAYTNGFEIIRGHLRQMSPGKGGRQA